MAGKSVGRQLRAEQLTRGLFPERDQKVPDQQDPGKFPMNRVVEPLIRGHEMDLFLFRQG